MSGTGSRGLRLAPDLAAISPLSAELTPPYATLSPQGERAPKKAGKLAAMRSKAGRGRWPPDFAPGACDQAWLCCRRPDGGPWSGMGWRPSNKQTVWAGLGLAIAAIIVIANWQWILFATVVFTAERRPALLKDAQWGQPTSDISFRARFRRGVPERELTTWLSANKFQVDPTNQEAARTISSLPCNEAVKVVWQSDRVGRIETANAEVSEAGCL
jgi:hypothetical protein